MDGIGPLRFVQWHPCGPTLERVSTVAQSVRPRSEHLPPTAGRHLVDVEPVDARLAVEPVAPERGADLRDDSVLTAVTDLELATRRRQVRVAGGRHELMMPQRTTGNVTARPRASFRHEDRLDR